LFTLTVITAFAQGTVDFKNDSTSYIRIGFGTTRLVTQSDGLVAALYWAPLSNPNNFTQLGPYTGVGGPVPPVPGLFFGGTRTTGPETLAGTAGQFIVRVWEVAYGSTFEAALQNSMGGRPALRGESTVFTLTTGNPGGSPPIPAANLQGTSLTPGFTGITVIPEPSGFMVGLAGLGALLMFRRSKRD
jgi:hypothetical protein